METKHTKGEWEIKANKELVFIKSGEKTICSMPTTDEDFHNAKLISASPDLLDACIQAYDKAIVNGKIDSLTIGILINAIKKSNNMTQEQIKQLKEIRNYFGEHDKTLFEHKAYHILDIIIKNNDSKRICKK